MTLHNLAQLVAGVFAGTAPLLARRLVPAALSILARANSGKETAMDDPTTDTASPTAGGDAPAAAAVAAPDPSRVVASVVSTVTAHPDVAPGKAAGVIASILAGLYQAEPAIFAVTRSSEKTQSEVGLGLGLMAIIINAFMHPGQ